MHAKTPAPITPANLPRLFAWAWLWLAKYAWGLVQGGPEAKRHLHLMARTLARLIVIRAAARFPKRNLAMGARSPLPPPGFARRRNLKPKHMVRAIIGGRLRRRLGPRGAGARLCALFNALVDHRPCRQTLRAPAHPPLPARRRASARVPNRVAGAAGGVPAR
jgi:hypothetical protein